MGERGARQVLRSAGGVERRVGRSCYGTRTQARKVRVGRDARGVGLSILGTFGLLERRLLLSLILLDHVVLGGL